MGSLVEDVKDKIDVVDFISGYLKLTPAGSNFRGLCPFHREKSPSFMVNREKQIFHCFGCGKGGDVITFVEEIEGMDFKEALKMLSERAGIDPARYQKKGSGALFFEKTGKKEKLFQILELSTQFFQKNLETLEGAKALQYFKSRGLIAKTIRDFRLGYSPFSGKNGSPQALFDFLRESGFGNEEILESGSVFTYQRDGRQNFMDRFRGRVVFPIFDSLGRPVGFSARILPGDTTSQGKYVNTPQTQLYDKGNLLYGFNLAKKSVREKGEIILLEGNLDVVLSHQAGIDQAVATCGTALSKKHLSFIRRYVRKIILAFDADVAGIKATKRASELAWEDDLDVKVIALKAGTDVADVCLKSPEKWQKMVLKKKSVPAFFFNLAFKGRNLSLDQKKILTEKLIKMIAKNPSEVEKAHYVRKIAEEVQVPESFLFERLKKEDEAIKKDYSPIKGPEAQQPRVEKNRKFLLEERIVGILYNFPKLYFLDQERIENVSLENPQFKSIWKEMIACLSKISEDDKEKFKISDLSFSGRDIKNKASEIALKIEKEMDDIDADDLEEARKELKYCLNSLLKEKFKKERENIVNLIKNSQKKNQEDDLKNLFSRLKELNEKIK